MGQDEDPQALADAVAAKLLEGDAATRSLGIEVQSVTPNRAILSMLVRDDMLNGHKTCHGGLIFALADSAFAFACNADNQLTVAQSCQISFTKPARLGDRLTAEAVEIAKGGRTGVYDCTIRNALGEIIAVFRGNAYRTSQTVLPC